ncbi:NXPE family member 3-like [Strongylocentrotus purpuratus]|uniref:NXPE C-terminal domain-containing protein n=1 Tax=Strongylocentrotus purpuratus TaxID=7668 RepID=A0A7M7PR11_STRPU|nr:NXPE family member 3-like [Strongylocentrotus purpuratus]
MSPQKTFLLIIVFIVCLITCGLWLDCGLGSCNSVHSFIQATGIAHNDVFRPRVKPVLYDPSVGDTGVVCPVGKGTGPVSHLTDAIQPSPPSNVRWATVENLTSAKYSDNKICNAKKVYFLHDQLELLIQARDGRRRLKQYGGDYFRAKIFTKNSTFSASSATDGEVIDLGDGTYRALFTLKWPGKVNVKVTLVHPSEAVDAIRRFRDAAPARFVYRGKFVSADGTHKEETFCNIVLSGNPPDLCNFTDKATGSPWFCYKPKSPKLKCSDWREHRCDSGAANRSDASLLSSHDKLTLIPKSDLPTRIQVEVRGTIRNSSEQKSASDNATTEVINLPICTNGCNIGNLLTSGYYFRDIWYNPSCRILNFPLDEMRNCVSGKKLYFLGDSTIRQLFEFYLVRLGPGLKKTQSGPEPRWHVGPTRALDQVFNISMMFRFHAYPIGRNSWATVKDIHYIANEVDSIVGDENSVVVISLWSHFTHEPEWFFVQRMRTIMAAVARLRERSPSTLVVFKGANTREHNTANQRLYNSDWLARRMEYIIRREIAENLAFMDSWSMSSAQLIADNVHPGGSHVKNLSNQLLTFMCGRPT